MHPDFDSPGLASSELLEEFGFRGKSIRTGTTAGGSQSCMLAISASCCQWHSTQISWGHTLRLVDFDTVSTNIVKAEHVHMHAQTCLLRLWPLRL